MKAIFEVEFNPDFMADQEQVDEIGGWLRMMQWLYEENDMGIFTDRPKLIAVEDVSKEGPPVIK